MKNWISILLVLSLFILPTTAKADVAGLKLCKDSKEFQRRLDQSVKKLESRIKKYDAGSPPALALQKQIEKEFGKDWRDNLLAKQAFYQGHFDAHKLKVKVEINYERNEMQIISDELTLLEKDNVKSRWNKFKKMKPICLTSRQRDGSRT